MTQRTPTMADVIQRAINSALLNVHTQMPACVISYNRENQSAVVKPCLKRIYEDGREVELPSVYNVPVVFAGSNSVATHYDLKPDDEILLVFSERSIDKWLVNGGVLASKDRRKFDLSDGIGIAGLRPLSRAITPQGDVGSYEIQTEKGLFELTKDGKFQIKNETDELMSVLVELIDKMILGNNLTSIGPQPKDPAYIQELNVIKSKLEGFKK